MSGQGKAVARANIAIAKYWGKADDVLNLPAVPSLSITLEPMRTETLVRLDERLASDEFELDGRPATEAETKKVSALLDDVRATTPFGRVRASVKSHNTFPTASGLASSASGFAALAAAAMKAYAVPYDARRASIVARRASASAARSVFGGFVELLAGMPGEDSLSANPLFDASHWDLRVIVAVVTEARKDVASRDGMRLSRTSSPYYSRWVERASELHAEIRDAIGRRDFVSLGPRIEQSFTAMHAVAFTTHPSTLYLRAGSIGALETISRMRARGVPVWPTMDAGPHVKAVCLAEDASAVSRALSETEGVLRTLEAAPGAGVEID